MKEIEKWQIYMNSLKMNNTQKRADTILKKPGHVNKQNSLGFNNDDMGNGVYSDDNGNFDLGEDMGQFNTEPKEKNNKFLKKMDKSKSNDNILRKLSEENQQVKQRDIDGTNNKVQSVLVSYDNAKSYHLMLKDKNLAKFNYSKKMLNFNKERSFPTCTAFEQYTTTTDKNNKPNLFKRINTNQQMKILFSSSRND